MFCHIVHDDFDVFRGDVDGVANGFCHALDKGTFLINAAAFDQVDMDDGHCSGTFL
jgi:hypothetical protein